MDVVFVGMISDLPRALVSIPKQHPRKEGKDEEKKSGETPESISGALIHPIPGDANLGVSVRGACEQILSVASNPMDE